MKPLDHTLLASVAGGLSKDDQLSTTLAQVQSSIKDLAAQNTGGGDQTTTMLMLALAMQNRSQTVVAAPVVAGPAFSIRARFRF